VDLRGPLELAGPWDPRVLSVPSERRVQREVLEQLECKEVRAVLELQVCRDQMELPDQPGLRAAPVLPGQSVHLE